MAKIWAYVVANWKTNLAAFCAFTLSVPQFVTAVKAWQAGQPANWHGALISLVVAAGMLLAQDAKTPPPAGTLNPGIGNHAAMRQVSALLLVALLALGTLPATSCGSQAVLTDVERFGPVVTDVLVAACGFTVSPLCTTLGPEINAAEQKLFTLWQAYITAQKNGTATPGLWNDLNAALSVVIAQAQQVFSLVHVINPAKQAEILAMATAAEGLLAVIETFLPASPGTSAVAVTHTVRQGGAITAHALHLPAPNPQTGQYDRAWFRSWVAYWNALPGVVSRHMECKA